MSIHLLSKLLLQVCLAVLVVAVSFPVYAFCPKNGFLCFATSKSSGSRTHEDITRISIENLDKTYFAVAKLTNSMQKALDQIVEADAAVDEDQKSSAKHFDGENATGAQARLATLRQNILDALDSDPINTTGARENLGSALHTIQDFYSHSNWVEMGNAGANPNVGRPVSLAFAGPSTPTCVSFTDTGITCANSSNLVTALLTSGYYGGEDRTKPAGAKCSHGGPLDKSSASSDLLGYFREGINKDTRYCDISPHSTYHDSAADAAIAGTKQFIEDIKGVISQKQLKALLGVGPTLAFAIDTTGSMGSVIAGVRSTAISIVDARFGTDEEPLQYVLSPFNDPFTGPVTVTNDVTTYKSAISSLFASGGGDCPELAMSGVYDGLASSDKGGDLFLFTDASAKDAGLAGAVTGLAAAKDIQIYPILFGSCSPIDPAYIQIANQTGGQVFFLNRSEASSVSQLADLLVRNNAVEILSVVDQYASAKTYALPIDSSLRQITVSVSSTDQLTLPTVTLTRPDGTVVSASDPVTYMTLSRGVIISIPNPTVGAWQLKVGGSASSTYVNVSGVSDLRFSSFTFDQWGGQPPHQGLFIIPGDPVVGQSLYAVASLTDGFATAVFQWRHKDFSLLSNLDTLEKDATDGRKFFGSVTVPADNILTYVTGTNSVGDPFQRVIPLTVSPQSVAIIAPASQDLRPGKTTSLLFQVKNFGASETFNFSITDDKGYPIVVTPISFTLGSAETTNVVVEVTPPAGAVVGSSDTLTATVQSATNSDKHNSAALTLYVTGAIETKGRPNFMADIINQQLVSPGVYNIDVRFTNTGPGTAKNFSINSLVFRTLTGSGTVAYNTTLAPALPLTTPNVDVGSFFTVKLTVNVPATVKRFSVTENGSILDIDGGTYAFSQGQGIIPSVK